MANWESVVIRDVETTAELHAVEDLQREVWGIPDLDVVPLSQLVAAQKAGGVLLGAFDKSSLVAFVYGFPAIENGEYSHHSHMLAVRGGYRGLNLGERLKLAQREYVLAQGIKTITWTFDPLRSQNAHLNFRKLGVSCDKYYADFYGDDSSSLLHRGGTDRLWVSWDLESRRVIDRIERNFPAPDLTSHRTILEVGNGGTPVIHIDERLDEEEIVIEIPSNLDDVEHQSDDLGPAWRRGVRQAFTKALHAGFLAVDFVRGPDKGRYLLSRRKIEP